MAVNPVSFAAAAPDTTEAAAGKSALLGNYEAFLQLLTTQLRTQSPLDPLDANQFTQQLVQFSTVEQAMRSNDRLDKLIELQLANQATALLGYVGSEITAVGSQAALKDGRAEWRYTAGGDGTANVTIRNSAGAVVYTEHIDLADGAGSFEWDGSTTEGQEAPAGTYSITIEGEDGDGNRIDVATEVKGLVTGIDFTGQEPALMVDGIIVPLGSLRTVKAVAQG